MVKNKQPSVDELLLAVKLTSALQGQDNNTVVMFPDGSGYFEDDYNCQMFCWDSGFRGFRSELKKWIEEHE